MKKQLLIIALAITTTFCKAQTTFPNVNHSIDLTEAMSMTTAFRTMYPTQVKANAFNKEAILTILNQEGCVGVRFYNALDSEGILHLVAVGLMADNSDMTSGYIMDRSICCKPGAPKCWPCSGSSLD